MTQTFQNRWQRLDDVLREEGWDGLVLNPGPSLAYLTDLHFSVMERPVVLLYRPGEVPALVVPGFEASKLEAAALRLRAFPYAEDVATWPDAFAAAVQATGLDGCRLGVEPRHLRVLELRYLQAAAPAARFDDAGSCLDRLRMQKDATEVAALRRAVQVAEAAFRATLPFLTPGVSERAVAAELVVQLLRAGSAPTLPFDPIVVFGENTAKPHPSPSERLLRTDEPILIDWGANADGYMADLTRVCIIGTPEPEIARMAALVREANARAVAAAGPGVPVCDVDRAARAFLAGEGYTKAFRHRVGHGIGREVHEAPYLRSDNDQRLAPGMTFTIEPGVYVHGVGGVRIEDDILVTPDGAASLSTLPRDWFRLG